MKEEMKYMTPKIRVIRLSAPVVICDSQDGKKQGSVSVEGFTETDLDW